MILLTLESVDYGKVVCINPFKINYIEPADPKITGSKNCTLISFADGHSILVRNSLEQIKVELQEWSLKREILAAKQKKIAK